MTDRRGSRFAFEVLFLVALATALTLAHLSALEIAGGMALGWIIVAALEWAAWRSEPHYGSGLPPRYYVPTVSLPPAQPLEQVATGGYPDASRDEAPTWIAPAALRAEVLGEWPVAASVAVPEEPEVGEADPWEVPEELPAAPLGELRREPEPEPEPEPVAVEPEPEPEVQVPGTAEAAPGTEVEPEPEPEPEPALDVALTESAQAVARYHLDPLAEPPPKRRFGRSGGAVEEAALEVPARPEGVRALPGRMARQD